LCWWIVVWEVVEFVESHLGHRPDAVFDELRVRVGVVRHVVFVRALREVVDAGRHRVASDVDEVHQVDVGRPFRLDGERGVATL
jgi:hypothetical protein